MFTPAVDISMSIPESFHDLFEGNSIGNITTLLPDGSPHTVPVWVGYDGDHLLVAGRGAKQRHMNVRNDPRVAITVVDEANQYRALLVRGEVTELTPDGAVEFLNRMSKAYLDTEEHPIQDENRLLMKIEPQHVVDASANV